MGKAISVDRSQVDIEPVAFELTVIWPWSRAEEKLRAKNIVSRVAYVLATLVLLIGTGVACALRDGLGPDAVESHGLLAVSRTIEEAWPVFVVSAALAFSAYWWGREETAK